MILSLDEIKKRIIQENDLQKCGSFSTDKQKNVQETMNILAQLMKKYPERIAEIEEQVADGEDHRYRDERQLHTDQHWDLSGGLLVACIISALFH